MQIEAGQVVILTYTATDAEGQVLERQLQPMAYLHGHGNFLDTLEPALEGLTAGERFEVTLDNAYGGPVSKDPIAVPKKEFPKGWRFPVGMAFTAPGSGDNTATLFVHRAQGSRVYVSDEHPWGGRSVTFVGQVGAVRPATESERKHGHAHGPGGHHH